MPARPPGPLSSGVIHSTTCAFASLRVCPFAACCGTRRLQVCHVRWKICRVRRIHSSPMRLDDQQDLDTISRTVFRIVGIPPAAGALFVDSDSTDQHALAAFLAPPKRLGAITTDDVQKLKYRLREHAPKTVNNVLTVLSVLLKKAVGVGRDRPRAVHDPARSSAEVFNGVLRLRRLRAIARRGEGLRSGSASGRAARRRSGSSMRRDDRLGAGRRGSWRMAPRSRRTWSASTCA